MLDGVIWLLRKIAHNCVLSCPLSCTKMAEDNARKRSLGEEGGEDEGMAKRAATGAATGDVSSGVQAFMLKVLCPRDSVGNIIGQGGSVIRDLNLTTGARIKVSQNNEHFPTTNDRIILISGCKEKINAALSEIITKIIQVCKNNYCVCCCCSYSHSFSLNSFPLTKSLLFVPFPFPHRYPPPIPTHSHPIPILAQFPQFIRHWTTSLHSMMTTSSSSSSTSSSDTIFIHSSIHPSMINDTSVPYVSF